ncbi:MAG: hypothetical protein P8X63_10685 [Desulfuromonadaceae bacterium]|jgi:hypothetical protein
MNDKSPTNGTTDAKNATEKRIPFISLHHKKENENEFSKEKWNFHAGDTHCRRVCFKSKPAGRECSPVVDFSRLCRRHHPFSTHPWMQTVFSSAQRLFLPFGTKLGMRQKKMIVTVAPPDPENAG